MTIINVCRILKHSKFDLGPVTSLEDILDSHIGVARKNIWTGQEYRPI